MARADRLFRLLDVLRRLPQPVTAARLAEETGVSLRSLYRDIDTLRAGGALIDGAAGLGYTLTEDPALPPQMFTRLEVEALVLGLGEVRVAGDPALAAAADAALAKITASLPERVQRQAIHATHRVHRYGTRPPVPTHMPLIRAATWEERALDIRYRDQTGRVSDRRIWPLSVVFLEQKLMLLAWCTLRQGFRKFHPDAMTDVTETTESFRPRRVPMLRQYLAEMRDSQASQRS